MLSRFLTVALLLPLLISTASFGQNASTEDLIRSLATQSRALILKMHALHLKYPAAKNELVKQIQSGDTATVFTYGNRDVVNIQNVNNGFDGGQQNITVEMSYWPRQLVQSSELLSQEVQTGSSTERLQQIYVSVHNSAGRTLALNGFFIANLYAIPEVTNEELIELQQLNIQLITILDQIRANSAYNYLAIPNYWTEDWTWATRYASYFYREEAAADAAATASESTTSENVYVDAETTDTDTNTTTTDSATTTDSDSNDSEDPFVDSDTTETKTEDSDTTSKKVSDETPEDTVVKKKAKVLLPPQDYDKDDAEEVETPKADEKKTESSVLVEKKSKWDTDDLTTVQILLLKKLRAQKTLSEEEAAIKKQLEAAATKAAKAKKTSATTKDSTESTTEAAE